jgi:LacI family transcriptional regulator
MKKPTSKDVAKLANVSQATVSMILNKKENVSFSEETVEKVLQAAKQLDYHIPSPAKPVNDSRKKLIALFTPTMINPYYPMLNQAIEETAIPQGYNVIVCNSYRNKTIEKYYLELLTENFIDGIIYTFSPTFPDVVKNISEAIPVVIIGEKDERLDVDTVGLNSYKSGMLVADHLISSGHKDIAFITTPLENMTLSRKQRYQGILDKLTEHGLEKRLVIKASTDERETSDSVYEIESGYTLTVELLKTTSVSAIVGVNDITACGVMNALNDAGYRVPQQISVCGFDNIFISSLLHPKLTTIDHCIQHRAKTATTIVIEKIEKQRSTAPHSYMQSPGVYKIEYEPQLIVRGSTGPYTPK